MRQRVTAIVVAHSGADLLERTLEAVGRQSRLPDNLVGVDVASVDRSSEVFARSSAAHLVAAPSGSSFGAAVSHALDVAVPPGEPGEWLWLLAHDNVPEPDALAALLGAVEIAPSVAIAGPKLMRIDDPAVIAEFGESMTKLGASVGLVASELDQAQHDVQNDVLGVSASGMLVRRSLWAELGGFDPALGSTDASLDFSIRARLAGHRVIGVPAAKVASAGGPYLFDAPRVSSAKRTTIARAAQLHRRLTYAPLAAVPLHWLSLLPLAIARSIVHLLAKRPGLVGAEFGAALTAAVGIGRVAAARRTLRRTKTLGWSSIEPLRITARAAREQRARKSGTAPRGAVPVALVEPLGFISGGGLWAVVITGLLGLIAFGTLLGSTTVVGGSLVPLADSVSQLWSNVGWGARSIGTGFDGAADPFAALLAVLGSITFWQPSLAIVLLYLVALPLASLSAWFCARRLSERPWLPALAAILWAVAPPFLGSLHTGHLGAAIVHIVLPVFVVLLLGASSSWAASAGAALVFAVIAASAPSTVPVLVLAWVALMVFRPSNAHRVLAIPLPAAVLFAPLVVDQITRGTPLGLLADPGVPSGGGTLSGLQLALGSLTGGSDGWTELLGELSLPSTAGPIVASALLLPLAVLAVLALFVRGSRRAIPALAVALVGYATAVLASRISVTSIADAPVALWSGAGASLYWLGLLGSAIVALDAIGRAATSAALLVGVASVLVAVPLISAVFLGSTTIAPSTDRMLPAFVDAEAQSRPDVGTLVLDPVAGDEISATLERGRGTHLDDQSTLWWTTTDAGAEEVAVATLAGNLVSRSGFDSAAELDRLSIAFVLLATSEGEETDAVTTRAKEALDGNALFVPVGDTAAGSLWRYSGDETASGEQADAQLDRGSRNTESVYGILVLVVQGLVVGLTVLLAIPTGLGRREVADRGRVSDRPATTFERTDDD
ncbi:glycosyltransferase [Marisediminicola sp. LYQ85]|uniref:glycosyltransferase n=1 Tax=Marisediminicola sp. LYQ85 TaxID=3391062 RepID=UPI003983D816